MTDRKQDIADEQDPSVKEAIENDEQAVAEPNKNSQADNPETQDSSATGTGASGGGDATTQ